MQGSVIRIAVMALLAYVGCCIYVFWKQRDLIYYPQPSAVNDPEARWMLPVDGAELHVSVRRREQAPAIIYFGGNAEDVSLSLDSLSRAFPRHALYLMHYRGYGASSGTASELHLHADALALYDRVAEQHAQISVVGRSLGSGVAVRLASRRPLQRLVLVTPYDSIQALAEAQFPWLPVDWLLQDKFESWRFASGIQTPTALIAAERDEVIPRAHTERLLQSFSKGVARLHVIPAVGHNTLSSSPHYLELLVVAASP